MGCDIETVNWDLSVADRDFILLRLKSDLAPPHICTLSKMPLLKKATEKSDIAIEK